MSVLFSLNESLLPLYSAVHVTDMTSRSETMSEPREAAMTDMESVRLGDEVTLRTHICITTVRPVKHEV